MTKQLTQKEQVAVFVRYRPNCAVGEVSDAMDMSGATAGKLLSEMSDQGAIIRTRNSVQFIYAAAPGADIADVILPCMVLKSGPAKIMEAEQKAKALADKGLWCRATCVYTYMFSIACSSVEVARIAKRRKECLRMERRA